MWFFIDVCCRALFYLWPFIDILKLKYIDNATTSQIVGIILRLKSLHWPELRAGGSLNTCSENMLIFMHLEVIRGDHFTFLPHNMEFGNTQCSNYNLHKQTMIRP